MPEANEELPVTMVLGRARPQVSRHVFRGGNFFMLRMLDRYRDKLGAVALPAEMELSALRTEEHLRTSTASVSVTGAKVQVNEGGQDDEGGQVGEKGQGGRLAFDVEVRNHAGHKFPTGYPLRRAWLHVVMTGPGGGLIFESGAVADDGSITGDDGDRDGNARTSPITPRSARRTKCRSTRR